MHLLADGVSRGEVTAVIVLCIVAIVFVLVNVVLLVSLHKGNIKLVKKNNTCNPKPDPAITEDNNHNAD